MASIVEYILKITSGKSQKNIRSLGKELKLTQKELEWFGKHSKENFNKVSSSSKNATNSLKNMRSHFVMLTGAITATGASLFAFQKQLADSINELVDASTRSGIATETLAGLRLALEGSGRSFSEVERGLDKFQKKIVKAASGSGDAAKMFNALGINVVDAGGNFRDTNDVFEETIKKIKHVNNQTAQGTALQMLFGRSGTAFKQSGILDDMDKFVQQAKELGPALDENGIKKAAKFQRGLAELKTSFVGFIQVVLEGITGETGIGPQMSKLAQQLKGFGKGLVDFIKEIKKFVDGIHKVIDPLVDTMGGLSGILTSMPGFGGLNTVVTVSEKVNQINKASTKEVSDLEKQYGRLQTRQEKILFLAKKFKDFETRRFVYEKVQDREVGFGASKITIPAEISFQEVSQAVDSLEESVDIKFDPNLFGGDDSKGKDPIKKLEASILSYQSKIDPKRLELIKQSLTFELPGIGTIQLPSILEKVEEVEEAEKNAIDAIQKMQDELKKEKEEVEKANNSFQGLKETVESIGQDKKPFQDLEEDIDLSIAKFKELGQSTIEAQKLKMKIIELRNEVLKLSQIKTTLKITADIVGLAGGDILGGITGLLEKSLSGKALELLGPVSGLVGGVVSFGQGMKQAGDKAIQEEEQRREQKQIQQLEQTYGRSLTQEEQDKVRRDIYIGESERREISDLAMRAKAEQDVKQFAMALEVGLRMLPSILFEVLPPLFIDLGVTIVKALFELPFRIAKALGQGVFNIGAKVAEAPLNIMKGLADFFGLDSKRSGGRILSARRGLRPTFTGSQDTLAQLHRNEYIVPESGARPQAVDRIMNQQSGNISINVSADIIERDAIEELVRRIEQRFQNFGTMQSSLFVG